MGTMTAKRVSRNEANMARWRLTLAPVLIATLAGCRRSPASGGEHVAPVVSSAAQDAGVPASGVAAQQVPHTQTQSVAKFVKDTLNECVDFTIQLAPPVDAGADWKPPSSEKLAEQVSNLFKNDKSVLRISKPCAEQFSDRTALASCSATQNVTSQRGDAVTVQILSRYYDFSNLDEDDLYMKQCLELHGDWQAVSRESNEYRRARLRANARKLGKITDKAIE